MGLRQVPLPAKLLTLPCVLANCESIDEEVASYILRVVIGKHIHDETVPAVHPGRLFNGQRNLHRERCRHRIECQHAYGFWRGISLTRDINGVRKWLP